MKKLFLPLAVLFSLPAYAADITAHVTGFDSSDGLMRFAMFSTSNEEFFPDKSSHADFSADAPIHVGQATVSISNVPAGVYAVFVYHDSNGNGLMDHKWYGTPAETFGYYRMYEVKLMPPDFDEVSFQVTEADMELQMNLQRY